MMAVIAALAGFPAAMGYWYLAFICIPEGWRTGNAKTFGNFVIALDNFFDFWIVHILAQSDRVQSIFGGDAQRLFA